MQSRIKLLLIVFLLQAFIPISSFGSGLPPNARIDSIVVIKQKHAMFVFTHHQLLKTYRVALGEQPVGPKHFQGDMHTPEGLYFINAKNPNSHYHKCLGISYPSEKDKIYARRFGKPTGGDVKIHGLPNGQGYVGKQHVLKDWTWGCIAVTNEEIDELFPRIKIGTPVNILP
jgi:murein L,D-transpeptidase YafK